MILYAGCRSGCCFVAGYVAGEYAALLFRKLLILGKFIIVYIFMTTKATGNLRKLKKQ